MILFVLSSVYCRLVGRIINVLFWIILRGSGREGGDSQISLDQ